eukprot:1586850-Prymnesium_polylepis.1
MRREPRSEASRHDRRPASHVGIKASEGHSTAHRIAHMAPVWPLQKAEILLRGQLARTYQRDAACRPLLGLKHPPEDYELKSVAQRPSGAIQRAQKRSDLLNAISACNGKDNNTRSSFPIALHRFERRR